MVRSVALFLLGATICLCARNRVIPSIFAVMVVALLTLIGRSAVSFSVVYRTTCPLVSRLGVYASRLFLRSCVYPFHWGSCRRAAHARSGVA